MSSRSDTLPADLTWVTPVILIRGSFDTVTGSSTQERHLGIFLTKMAATDVQVSVDNVPWKSNN